MNTVGVCFYGIPSADFADVTKIKVPVLCHFAQLDNIAGFSDPKVWPYASIQF